MRDAQRGTDVAHGRLGRAGVHGALSCQLRLFNHQLLGQLSLQL
jgi:hypothetical protein